eukprot:gene21084-27323_t
MDDKIKITFDKEYKIRLLEESKFNRANELQSEGVVFVDKITNFHDKVDLLVDVLEKHAARIDSYKLKAIGLRLAVENENESRNRQIKSIQAIISEKKAELDRYTTQLNSLERIESDQKAILEKMTNNRK